MRIRIELPDPTCTTGHVYYVQPDGSEIEISSAVTGFDIHAKVGEVTTCRLDIIGVTAHLTAEVVTALDAITSEPAA